MAAGRRAESGGVGEPRHLSQLQPGDVVRVRHTKAGTRTISMTCTVDGWSADGVLVLRRTFKPGGRYDSIGAPKLAGDYGTIEVVPGGWVLRRTYRRAGGQLIAELFNVQTPAEVLPGEVRYLDLEVDVVRFADGRVEVVDLDDLAAVEQAGGVSHELAATARRIAEQLATVLRQGGDWRTADIAERATT